MPARARKQRRPYAVEPLGDGGELEAQADAGLEHHQPVARGEVIEPLPQRADWLRGIVAVYARRLAAIRGVELGHILLDANGHRPRERRRRDDRQDVDVRVPGREAVGADDSGDHATVTDTRCDATASP